MSKTIPTASKSKTKADFRNQFDKNTIIPRRIQAAIDALAKMGPENWEVEKEFLTRTGLSVVDLATFRPQFEEFIVVVRNESRHEQRVWCCSKKLATELRGFPT